MPRYAILTLLVIATLSAAVAVAIGRAGDENRAPRICISAIGPVDQNGNGDTTPDMVGDCP